MLVGVDMALFADVLDHLEWKSGLRVDGTAMSLNNIITVGTVGICTGLFNLFLSQAGYAAPSIVNGITVAASQPAAVTNMATAMRFQGAGSSHINPTKVIQPADAIEHISLAEGCDAHGDTTEALLANAVEAARAADVAVVFAGLPNRYESEGFDRTDMYAKMGFKSLDSVIDPKQYAIRNFHGQYYLDSDKLDDYLHFRSDDMPYDVRDEGRAPQQGRREQGGRMVDSATPRDVVLVVEDDSDITELLTLYLSGGGYEVRTAGDGIEGLEALRAGGVSVVLVDVMPLTKNGKADRKALLALARSSAYGARDGERHVWS